MDLWMSVIEKAMATAPAMAPAMARSCDMAPDMARTKGTQQHGGVEDVVPGGALQAGRRGPNLNVSQQLQFSAKKGRCYCR